MYPRGVTPQGKTGLLFAESKRAEQWRRGLAGAGIACELRDTRGSDSARGDVEVLVEADHAAAARRFVSEVLSGVRSLPAPPRLSGPLVWIAAALALGILGMIAAAYWG